MPEARRPVRAWPAGLALLALAGCAASEPPPRVPMPAEVPAARPPQPVEETPRNPAATGGPRALLGPAGGAAG
ncbi:hypothetical protein LPC08_13290 [Roseomonas sp. OT10]|uniref:hypothetical protein n=1 Tax=Roseomonas cutis TaxID=2897332 RepID=UPI001E3E02FC|nr:hypothetical protein [Roseomonas sp. OT10]UFN47002.1 hypothetical protein LPC08_13290 [Roseomonas sp. OT10]